MSKPRRVCDFCSEDDVCARLFCTDIDYIEHTTKLPIGFTSKGDWGACIICLDLIGKKRKIQLTNRSYQMLKKHWPGLTRLSKTDQMKVRRELAHIQDMFWKSWTGMVEPVDMDNPRRRRRKRKI